MKKKENILKVNEKLINVLIDYKRIFLVCEILIGGSVWFYNLIEIFFKLFVYNVMK